MSYFKCNVVRKKLPILSTSKLGSHKAEAGNDAFVDCDEIAAASSASFKRKSQNSSISLWVSTFQQNLTRSFSLAVNQNNQVVVSFKANLEYNS